MPCPKIAILTGRDHPGIYHASEHRITQALASRGAIVTWLRWSADDVDWSCFDLVLIRTTWDYVAAGAARFMNRLEEIGRATRLVNDAATVVLNIDKRYLRALAEAGAPVIDTEWIARADVESVTNRSLLETLHNRGWDDAVIKPVVGAAASGLMRFDRARLEHPGDAGPSPAEHVRTLLASYEAVLVQPFLPSVVSRGETSMLYFEGRFSHAVRKVPRAGEIRVQREYGARHVPHEPSAAELAAAEAVLRAWCVAFVDEGGMKAGPPVESETGAALRRAGSPPVYARIDLVDAASGEAESGDPRLMELEVIEPELFLEHAATSGIDAAGRLAEAVIARAVSDAGGMERRGS